MVRPCWQKCRRPTVSLTLIALEIHLSCRIVYGTMAP